MRHRCAMHLPARVTGPAINKTLEDQHGRLWVTNDEYWSQVNFCPICGFQAPTPVNPVDLQCDDIDGVSRYIGEPYDDVDFGLSGHR